MMVEFTSRTCELLSSMNKTNHRKMDFSIMGDFECCRFSAKQTLDFCNFKVLNTERCEASK